MFRWDGSLLAAEMERDISWLVLTILRGFDQVLKDPVHDTDNRGHTPEILRDVEKTALAHPVFCFFVHFDVGPAEAVDALLGITHEKEVGRRQSESDLRLEGIRVLEFINQ